MGFDDMWNAAKTGIDKFQTQQLRPLMNQTKLADDVELANDQTWHKHPCPKLDPALKEVIILVEKAETQGKEVLVVRSQFIEALKDLADKIDVSRKDFDRIDECAREIAQTMDMPDLHTQITDAAILNDQLQRLEASAREADKFKEIAQKFIAAVAAANEELETARKRQTIAKDLDTISSKIQEAQSSLFKASQGMVNEARRQLVIPDLKSMQAELSEIRYRASNLSLDELTKRLSELKERSTKELDSMQASLDKASAAGKDAFEATKARFETRVAAPDKKVEEEVAAAAHKAKEEKEKEVDAAAKKAAETEEVPEG